MQKILLLISVFLSGFFPYMPTVHAEGFLGHGESHCGTHQSEKHDMSICREVTSEIGLALIAPPETVVFPPFFHFYTWSRGDEYHRIKPIVTIPVYTPVDSPPRLSPPDLVGIVIITT